jgi:hypothetical protein
VVLFHRCKDSQLRRPASSNRLPGLYFKVFVHGLNR